MQTLPTDLQQKVLDAISPETNLIVTMPSSFGKTTALVLAASQLFQTLPGVSIVVLVGRNKEGLGRMTPWFLIKNRIKAELNIPVTSIPDVLHDPNTMSTITFYTSDNTMRGINCDVLLVDELDDVDVKIFAQIFAPMLMMKGVRFCAFRTDRKEVPKHTANLMKWAKNMNFASVTVPEWLSGEKEEM